MEEIFRKVEVQVPSKHVKGHMTSELRFAYRPLCQTCLHFIDTFIADQEKDAVERRVACAEIPGIFNGLGRGAYLDHEGKLQGFPNVLKCNKFKDNL